MPKPGRRADILVFALALLGTGYFHQGGGWNQNARFAMVRSIVEQQSFTIDDYLVYERAEADSDRLQRVPLRSGNFERGGREYALSWQGAAGKPVAVDYAAAGNRRLASVDAVAASGDISYFGGHLHPNKAPGTSFLAVPGYALVRAVESVFGADPDSWAVLTWNAWLASLLSVSFATAIGAVLVLRLARRHGSETSARLAALCYAFATMALPLGSMLFEHNIIAVALLGGLYLLDTTPLDGRGPPSGAARLRIAAAGFLVGYAAITNYTMAAFVPLFALYLLMLRRWALEPVFAFGAGVFVPFVVICLYNVACFGTPFTTNYAYESPMFLAEDRFLGVFAMPRPDVLLALLVSPYRGIFFSSPVLLLSFAVLVVWWREGRERLFVLLTGAVFIFLLLLNASFNGWDGGWTAVPRYLAPAVGLLCVPLVVAFDRWRSLAWGLASVSFVIQLTMTIVDPQAPIGDAGAAGLPVSKVFGVDPMQRYVVPLFTKGRAWPMLEDSIENALRRQGMAGLERDEPTAEIERKAAALRAELVAKIEAGEAAPFELGAVTGPVSANPIGIYEGYYFQLFAPGSEQARGNSFNLGETLFPASRLSLLPFLLAFAALLLLLFQQEESEVAVAAVAAAPPLAAPPVARPTTKAATRDLPPRGKRRRR